MTLPELMTLAGTDPDRIITMSESDLKAYLSPLFPDCRPSVERAAAVERKAKIDKAQSTLKAMDLFDQLRNKS